MKRDFLIAHNTVVVLYVSRYGFTSYAGQYYIFKTLANIALNYARISTRDSAKIIAK